MNRTAQGLKPRVAKVEPPSDAEIARVVHQISRRIVRKRRHPGYLEAGEVWLSVLAQAFDGSP